MNSTIRLEGMKDLEKQLFKLKGTTAKSSTRKAMKEALEPIARAARLNAPVLSGELQEGVEVTSRVAPYQRKKSDLEMYMGPGRDPQAITQEFGTYFHPAQPFMRPAWEAGKMGALDDFGAMMWVNVTKAVARAERKAARAK